MIAFGHNLPNILSSFIGREQEVVEIKARLASHRLVTITGPGGGGKTRLTIRTAHELVPLYPDGVWLVELAPLADPVLVPQAIGAVLGVRERSGNTLIAVLTDHLSSRNLLLVLDNCEHLISACAEVAETLLSACSDLRILATSREPLGISGETVWTVPPLTLPDPQPWRDPESGERALATYQDSEAVRLFVERAKEASSTFSLNIQNGNWISDICRRLDGMPLAIELAAARVRTLSVQQIAERLGDAPGFASGGLRLLTGGLRTAPPRHQTLEATLDWSYALLDDRERKVLERLSIFAGGCTLEAVEAICAGSEIENSDILDILSRLVDKSLVVVNKADRDTRYFLLETIRQYASKKLSQVGEAEDIRARHLNYFIHWAENASPYLFGSHQLQWIARFETEHDNLRAALEWSQKNDAGAYKGLQLAIACARFWQMHSYLSEGRDHISVLLAQEETRYGRDAKMRAEALYALGRLAYLQSEYPATRSFAEESLTIWQEMGAEGRVGVANMLTLLAEVATEEGDYITAMVQFEEAHAIYKELKHAQGFGDSLMQLSWAVMRMGNYEQVASQLGEALTMFREIGTLRAIGLALSGLGELAIRQGQYEKALHLLEESLTLRREGGERWGMGTALGSLGWIALRQRDFRRMRTLFAESIAVRMDIGDKSGIAWCLEKLGEAATLLAKSALPPARFGILRQGVRNFGAAAALRFPIHSVVDPVDQPEYDRILAVLRSGLGNDVFEMAWSEGKTMPLDMIVEDALCLLDFTEQPQQAEWGGLSPREQEAAILIAQGKSNREIAEMMTVGVKTVETYVTRILNKLSFDSRVQIAVWAKDKGLA